VNGEVEKNEERRGSVGGRGGAEEEVGDGKADYKDVGRVSCLVTQRHGDHKQVADETNDCDESKDDRNDDADSRLERFLIGVDVHRRLQKVIIEPRRR